MADFSGLPIFITRPEITRIDDHYDLKSPDIKLDTKQTEQHIHRISMVETREIFYSLFEYG